MEAVSSIGSTQRQHALAITISYAAIRLPRITEGRDDASFCLQLMHYRTRLSDPY
jgi:hypothetical protein